MWILPHNCTIFQHRRILAHGWGLNWLHAGRSWSKKGAEARFSFNSSTTKVSSSVSSGKVWADFLNTRGRLSAVGLYFQGWNWSRLLKKSKWQSELGLIQFSFWNWAFFHCHLRLSAFQTHPRYHSTHRAAKTSLPRWQTHLNGTWLPLYKC